MASPLGRLTQILIGTSVLMIANVIYTFGYPYSQYAGSVYGTVFLVDLTFFLYLSKGSNINRLYYVLPLIFGLGLVGAILQSRLVPKDVKPNHSFFRWALIASASWFLIVAVLLNPNLPL